MSRGAQNVVLILTGFVLLTLANAGWCHGGSEPRAAVGFPAVSTGFFTRSNGHLKPG